VTKLRGLERKVPLGLRGLWKAIGDGRSGCRNIVGKECGSLDSRTPFKGGEGDRRPGGRARGRAFPIRSETSLTSSLFEGIRRSKEQGHKGGEKKRTQREKGRSTRKKSSKRGGKAGQAQQEKRRLVLQPEILP